MAKKLWTKNFTLIIVATTFGAMGGVAGNFALSFLVFEETKSTFAAALIAALSPAISAEYSFPFIGRRGGRGPVKQQVVSGFIRRFLSQLPRKKRKERHRLSADERYILQECWNRFCKENRCVCSS